MKRAIIALILTSTVSFAATAQTSMQLTPDQKGYIAYDQCMKYAAIRASHTDAKDEEIFGIAKVQCASTRSRVVVGQESNDAFLAALDAADADKSANFPAWIKGVRERRKSFEAQGVAPPASPSQ